VAVVVVPRTRTQHWARPWCQVAQPRRHCNHCAALAPSPELSPGILMQERSMPDIHDPFATPTRPGCTGSSMRRQHLSVVFLAGDCRIVMYARGSRRPAAWRALRQHFVSSLVSCARQTYL